MGSERSTARCFFLGEFRFSTIVNKLGGNGVRNTRHSLLGLLGGMLKLVPVNGEIANSSNEMRSSLKVIKSSCPFWVSGESRKEVSYERC